PLLSSVHKNERKRMRKEDLPDLEMEIEGQAKAMAVDVAELHGVAESSRGEVSLPGWAIGIEITVFDAKPHLRGDLVAHPGEGLPGEDGIADVTIQGRAVQGNFRHVDHRYRKAGSGPRIGGEVGGIWQFQFCVYQEWNVGEPGVMNTVRAGYRANAV